MVISKIMYEKGKVNNQEPNIFRAAADDDVDGLMAALDSGQSLDLVDPKTSLTPVMIALLQRSEEFLQAALQRHFDPWIRDANERLAIDHANALGMRDVQRKLYARMYDRPRAQVGKVVELGPR